MDRFSGWTRGTLVAALVVLSTGACAQRVVSPPQVAARSPVAEAPVVIAPRAAPVAPVAKQPPASAPTVPPRATAPAEPEPAPRRTTPPRSVAEAPVARPVIAPPPAPRVARLAPLEEPEARRSPEPPAAPKVAVNTPAELGGQYRTAEVASADYGSAVDSNPTPDSALDIASLFTSDAPPAQPATKAPPAPVQTVDEPVDEPLSALAKLFGTTASQPGPAPLQEPEARQVANAIDAVPAPADDPARQANPYPGGFDDDQAYDTAQLAQPNYGYNPAPAPTPAFNPGAPVTVAILTPDTDSRASIRTLAKGLAQAAALSARSIGNQQLVLRGYDTGGTPEKARLAAQQALADGAQLIIGPLFSTSASAVAPLAQSAGVPVIAFTTDRGVLRRGLYTVGYLPDTEVDRMLSYAAQRGIRKIGLLSPDTPYGGIVYRNVQNSAPGYGVTVATVQPISTNFAQASQTGQRFADFYKANPDTTGVLIATNGKPLQGIAAYLAYNDVLPSKVQYMGLGTWDDPETFREATLRGGWFPGLDPALKTEFETRYRAAYGGSPPAIAALAYDGVAIAGALLQRAQSTGQPPFTVQNIETPTGFRGMSGLFRFLPDGRNQRLLSILKVGRRQFEMVDPAPSTFSQRVTSISGYSQ